MNTRGIPRQIVIMRLEDGSKKPTGMFKRYTRRFMIYDRSRMDSILIGTLNSSTNYLPDRKSKFNNLFFLSASVAAPLLSSSPDPFTSDLFPNVSMGSGIPSHGPQRMLLLLLQSPASSLPMPLPVSRFMRMRHFFSFLFRQILRLSEELIVRY